jgi:hypothetical protein
MALNESVSDLDLTRDISDQTQRIEVLPWHKKQTLLSRFCRIIGEGRYQSGLTTAVACRKSAADHARDIYQGCLGEDCTILNADGSCNYKSKLEGLGDPNSAYYHSFSPQDRTMKHPEMDSLVDALINDHTAKFSHQASTSRRVQFPGRSTKRIEKTTHEEKTEDELLGNDREEIDSRRDTEEGAGDRAGRRFEKLSARLEDLKTRVKKRGRYVYLPRLRSRPLTDLESFTG